MKKTQTGKQKWNSKRIVALIGIILLFALYIVTLFVAIFVPDQTGNILRFCIFGTVAIPSIIWVYIWMYGKLTGKHTIADVNYLQESEDTE